MGVSMSICPYWEAKEMHLYVAHECAVHGFVQMCHGCGVER